MESEHLRWCISFLLHSKLLLNWENRASRYIQWCCYYFRGVPLRKLGLVVASIQHDKCSGSNKIMASIVVLLELTEDLYHYLS